MQDLRKITNSRQDRIADEEVHQCCKIKQIGDWILCRKNKLNDHVNRMAEDELAKIVRYNRNRLSGRPRKR